MTHTEVVSTSPVPACMVTGAVKNYGGVRALTGVDLEVYPGLIHAIVGENGAGKSTLMKVMVGAVQPDAGTVVVRSEQVAFENVMQANEHGIAIVFQELSLFPELDVLANLFLRREPVRFGLISRSDMRHMAQPILDELGLDADVDAPVSSLRLGEQQLVEIAKALLADAEIIIFDEPNSALNATESERLFNVIRQLRDRGVAVIYISHRLEEVFAIANVITVMRNGAIVETVKRDETTIPEIVAAMIGREPTEVYEERKRDSKDGAPLRLEGVTVEGKVYDVNLTIEPGEIVGLAGLEGAGVEAVFDLIFGVRVPDKGHITLPNGRPAPRSIPAAVRAGIALVPADRRKEGLMLEQTAAENMLQVTAGVLGKLGFFLNRGQLEQRAQRRINDLHIVLESPWSRVNQLSGGNQQKVVVGKWLEANPHVILLNDPTRGVDVGAKVEIYHIIQALADEGHPILFTSTELPEFVGLCDRVVVFYRGRTCGELSGDSLIEHRILEAINTGQV